MQLGFNLDFTSRAPEKFLALPQGRIPLHCVRNGRARRYVLRLKPDGSAQVTIPRGGSAAEAHKFAARNIDWLHRAVQKMSARPVRPSQWFVGAELLLRGESLKIESSESQNQIRLGSETIAVKDAAADLRPEIERHLWQLAATEFPPRVFVYATLHQLTVRKVTVRDQKSRWGSCSRHANISLNWRLIQTPEFVQNYLILHELMHLRQMNHSRRYWREVETVCPDYRSAEKWLRKHSNLLR